MTGDLLTYQNTPVQDAEALTTEPKATAEFEPEQSVHIRRLGPSAVGRAMSTWQPIETAPTDYTEVIGMDEKGNVARTWFFAPSSRTQNWLKWPRNTHWNPTHWIPLPRPPEGDEA